MSIERHHFVEVTPWTGEHIHRYIESARYIREGDVILDLACGSGYGADILSKVSNTKIYAGDIDPAAITACRKDWEHNTSISFEIMDATSLPFKDAFFDVIVSLETIEHLIEYRKMLSEFGRVVKPGGTVIISTPNIKISSPDGNIINPFHTQEFTYEELNDILRAEFATVDIYGQKYVRYPGKWHSWAKRRMENLLLARGIRKLPYKVRNSVFESFFGQSLYPTSHDFQLFSEKEFAEKNCHVLFAVCRK
ncbi:bifunctional 2-polyprenyl-6-hydroxyphenol methylase/3-demethylubiquinol 3-O-methyltransferase UbiG [Mucilaginibacter sp. L3T2-6]|uniref:class I SAM-dependent methyltransferase n=1 Tax=Mucilaginibacter sp. L3T2-6 TaxID=3062491 RepID=UPI002676BC69|nr:class I SAM-dependent methyltransferase [Mucilaginibacter sp. L3T2-6]MDO3642233.1 class I SAM-dependent methyltransferase [Mucilaginibacter sp. L3T2-6]MDV6214728.1 class I SAM-dependent methyltransferase [Mucilaginibacter sp. L3T2-6]